MLRSKKNSKEQSSPQNNLSTELTKKAPTADPSIRDCPGRMIGRKQGRRGGRAQSGRGCPEKRSGRGRGRGAGRTRRQRHGRYSLHEKDVIRELRAEMSRRGGGESDIGRKWLERSAGRRSGVGQCSCHLHGHYSLQRKIFTVLVAMSLTGLQVARSLKLESREMLRGRGRVRNSRICSRLSQGEDHPREGEGAGHFCHHALRRYSLKSI
jgi:hypothetical protein